jgi:hypothetical protein
MQQPASIIVMSSSSTTICKELHFSALRQRLEQLTACANGGSPCATVTAHSTPTCHRAAAAAVVVLDLCALCHRCGDLYGDKAVDTFNACAVSEEKCVPQRADEGLYPVPPDCALDKGFDIKGFTGRWFITAGLNPLFDIFDCQVRLLLTVCQPGCRRATYPYTNSYHKV